MSFVASIFIILFFNSWRDTLHIVHSFDKDVVYHIG